jgi:hypothetical protein
MSGTKKLTPRQAEVMTWLVGGHQPYLHSISTVYVNGQKLCNLDTMTALEKRGYAEKVTSCQWRITAKGATEGSPDAR